MATKRKKRALGDASIAENRKARHDFFIEEDFEADLDLDDPGLDDPGAKLAAD